MNPGIALSAQKIWISTIHNLFSLNDAWTYWAPVVRDVYNDNDASVYNDNDASEGEKDSN